MREQGRGGGHRIQHDSNSLEIWKDYLKYRQGGSNVYMLSWEGEEQPLISQFFKTCVALKRAV